MVGSDKVRFGCVWSQFLFLPLIEPINIIDHSTSLPNDFIACKAQDTSCPVPPPVVRNRWLNKTLATLFG